MLLECKNLYKEYTRGKMKVPVLKDISLSVEQGEYIAIMGPSGSGKTTLMNLIGCLDVPTSGSLVLNEEELEKMNSKRMADVRNQVLGFVFQQADLLPGLNARENVALPLLYRGLKKQERNEKAEEALVKVGLADRIDFKPNQLSGGQCQRVAIARAIVGSPKLLLADEPTGALDTQSGRQVMELFRQLHNEGITIIMITHSEEVAQEADRIVYIRDGILSEETPVAAQKRLAVTEVIDEEENVTEEVTMEKVITEETAPVSDEVVPEAEVTIPENLTEDAPAMPNPWIESTTDEEKPVSENVTDTALNFVQSMRDTETLPDLSYIEIEEDSADSLLGNKDSKDSKSDSVLGTAERFAQLMNQEYTSEQEETANE